MKLTLPKKIKDMEGKEWPLKVTAKSIFLACRNTGLTIADIMDAKIGIDHLLSALPWFCDDEIKKVKITHEEFLDRFGVEELSVAVHAFFPAVADAFPVEGDIPDKGEVGGDEAPLAAPGLAKTS